MKRILVLPAFVIACAFSAASSPGVLAQTSAADARTIVGELAKLRASVDSGFQVQLEAQVLAAQVTVHQQRVGTATLRLDAIRKELWDVGASVTDLEDQVRASQRSADSPPGTSLAPTLRDQAERDRRKLDRERRREQELLRSEAALAAELRTEESALADAMRRLEQIKRR